MLDFSTMKPWKEISTVTVDGEAMVYIPKFYIKTGTYTSGTYSGCQYRLVSPYPSTGFRIHPAFMYNNAEKNGIYIARYLAYNKGSDVPGSANNKTMWKNITFADALAAANSRNTESSGAKAGWHILNVYELSAIQLLMLIEIGTTDVTNAIAKGSFSNEKTGSSDAKWRGLDDLWGGEYFTIWIDGIKTDSSRVLSIFKNDGSGSYVSTGVTHGDGSDTMSYIKTLSDAAGTGFNCADIFTGTTCDTTTGVIGYRLKPSSAASKKIANALVFGTDYEYDFAYAGMYFRLAKYDI